MTEIETPRTLIVSGAREGGFPRADLGADRVRDVIAVLEEDIEPSSVLLPDLRCVPVATPSRNPYAVYLATLAKGEARRAMQGCLDRIATLFADRAGLPLLADPPGMAMPWASLRYEHAAAIRALVLDQPWSPSYGDKHMTALRMVLKHAWLLGHMSAEDYHRAAAVKGIKGHRLPAGRSVAAAERRAMIAAALAGGTTKGLRDAALIAALYATGCRREEMADARLDAYDPGRRALRVIGKGDKEREVYLTEYAAGHVGGWLAEAGRGEYLMRPVTRWGAIEPRGMTADAIGKAVGARAKQAGVPHVAAHDLRRSFVGDLLDAGVDLATVQKLAGHASAATTARYDRRPARTRQAAVDRLDTSQEEQ